MWEERTLLSEWIFTHLYAPLSTTILEQSSIGHKLSKSISNSLSKILYYLDNEQWYLTFI